MRSGKRAWFSTSGPQAKELGAIGLAPDDRVRVADGDRDELDRLSRDVDRLGLPHLDRAHVRLDLLALAHLRDDLARADRDAHGACAASAGKPASRDSRPVARELGGRAVGVPDDDLGGIAVRRRDLDDAVGADAEVVVADPLHPFGRQREGKLSPLDQQVIVAEPVPLRELHLRCRPEGDPQAG